MSEIISLNEEQLPSDCYLFKHSTTCPISADAAAEVRKYQWDLPLYWVNVIEQRPISNWVAESYLVKHESPQLLYIRASKVTKVLNHRNICEKNF